MSSIETPEVTTDPVMPRGVPFIVFNELAERYSFFGLRTILVVYMTKQLLDSSGNLAPMGEADARAWYHAFEAALYFFPLLGAILSDGVLGKYRTILYMSLVYCMGHLVLAVDITRSGLMIGLALIAVGAGGIKPCVMAHMGDQFGKEQIKKLGQWVAWFYLAINVAGFGAAFTTPWLMEHYGSGPAFAVPGILMFLATLIFWLGRRYYVAVPPAGMAVLKETLSWPSLKLLGELLLLYTFVSFFWATAGNAGSSWVQQAQKLDLTLFGVTFLPSQIQASVPLLNIGLIPLLTYGIYPLVERYYTLTTLRKIGLGLLFGIPAVLIPTWIEWQLSMGAQPSVAWQLLAYLILGIAETLIAVTCMELTYTRAPRMLKSMSMAMFALSVSLGSLFTSVFNLLIRTPDGSSRLEGVSYHLFFAGMLCLVTVVYALVSQRMAEVVVTQDAG